MWNNNYELYHHGVKGMKWGVRKKTNRETRDAELTPEQRKKRANIKRGVIIGSSVAASALAVYGGMKLKRYIDERKRAKAGQEAARKIIHEFNKMALEQEMQRMTARAEQARRDAKAGAEFVDGAYERIMGNFKRQYGFS